MSEGSRNSHFSRKRSSSPHSPTFQVVGHGLSRAKGQQHYHKGKQKVTSVTQLDHSFYKAPGEVQNLKVLTFVETVSSMPGAIIVPDLSANQVAIKALKNFIEVNGFTKSLLQCDGHSGLLALQEQVGHEMSLPTQVSPPYSHQSQGTVERFHTTLYVQVRAIRFGLADQVCVNADQIDAAFMPWIIQHAAFQINRYLVRSDAKTSLKKVFNKPQRSPIVHFGERVLAHIQSQPRPQNLQIWASPKKSFGLWLGKDVISGMHIVSLVDGQVLRTRTIARLIREDQFKRKNSGSSRLLLMSQVFSIKKIHMIRCSSRILFRSSCLNKRIRSPLSHQRQTPRSLIPQILFRILPLRERLQFLQPRERVVQAQDYLILEDYLILQDYLNLKQESSHPQSWKSACLLLSSKESWRSMTTQSIVIKV